MANVKGCFEFSDLLKSQAGDLDELTRDASASQSSYHNPALE